MRIVRTIAHKTMKAIQVAAPGAPMELVEIPIPQPGDRQVLIKVEACDVCHGDAMVAQGFACMSHPSLSS